jgi:ribosome-associated protein
MADLEVNARLTIPSRELRLSFVRSPGPGGQNVNKVATAVQLRWDLQRSAVLAEADREWLLERLARRLSAGGELIVSASEHRSQAQNRAEARAKLAALVQQALLRPRPRRKTRPTRGSVERRLAAKQRRGQRKRQRAGAAPED